MTQLTLPLSTLKRDWIDKAAAAVLSKPSGTRFTSDDLHDWLPQPEVDNWFGCVMARLRNEGHIRRPLVYPQPSRRPERNGAVVFTWEVV